MAAIRSKPAGALLAAWLPVCTAGWAALPDASNLKPQCSAVTAAHLRRRKYSRPGPPSRRPCPHSAPPAGGRQGRQGESRRAAAAASTAAEAAALLSQAAAAAAKQQRRQQCQQQLQQRQHAAQQQGPRLLGRLLAARRRLLLLEPLAADACEWQKAGRCAGQGSPLNMRASQVGPTAGRWSRAADSQMDWEGSRRLSRRLHMLSCPATRTPALVSSTAPPWAARPGQARQGRARQPPTCHTRLHILHLLRRHAAQRRLEQRLDGALRPLEI